MMVWMVDVEKDVTESVGQVVITIQRSGDRSSDVQVYCFVAAGNIEPHQTFKIFRAISCQPL